MISEFYRISGKEVQISISPFLFSIKDPSRRSSTNNVKQERVHYVVGSVYILLFLSSLSFSVRTAY